MTKSTPRSLISRTQLALWTFQDSYGIEEGDLVAAVLPADNGFDAVRRQAVQCSVRHGKVIAETQPAALNLDRAEYQPSVNIVYTDEKATGFLFTLSPACNFIKLYQLLRVVLLTSTTWQKLADFSINECTIWKDCVNMHSLC